MVRLDKYVAQLKLVPRRSVGKVVKSGLLLVDWIPAEKSDMKLRYWQIISYWWLDIEVKEFVYVLLYKPSWYVCSDIDEWGHASYQQLLQDCPYGPMLHVAWRLDFDTEWLVLCSNDGQFTHNIISPKKKLEKEYYLRTRDEIHDKALYELAQWVTLDDWYTTLPAIVKKDWSQSMRMIIVEGKFHQVKRMLEAVWNEVTYLRRDRIGSWTIDGIKMGWWKYTEKEG